MLSTEYRDWYLVKFKIRAISKAKLTLKFIFAWTAQSHWGYPEVKLWWFCYWIPPSMQQIQLLSIYTGFLHACAVNLVIFFSVFVSGSCLQTHNILFTCVNSMSAWGQVETHTKTCQKHNWTLHLHLKFLLTFGTEPDKSYLKEDSSKLSSLFIILDSAFKVDRTLFLKYLWGN